MVIWTYRCNIYICVPPFLLHCMAYMTVAHKYWREGMCLLCTCELLLAYKYAATVYFGAYMYMKMLIVCDSARGPYHVCLGVVLAYPTSWSTYHCTLCARTFVAYMPAAPIMSTPPPVKGDCKIYTLTCIKKNQIP